ncbi:MAG: hypothetical protein QOI51_954 [Nocardioidaceae bacterium]|nr:hypothetical protein [Nocardioidaceae bacterium]
MRLRPRSHSRLVRSCLAGLAGSIALASLVAGTATGGPAHLDLASNPSMQTLPGRIGAPAKVLQMVTITSPDWGSTTGTLKAWQRPPGGAWASVHGPLPVVLGYHGWVVADQRVQSSGTSPAGRFGLPAAFGLLADPGTALEYRHVDGNDWWPYEPRDPATYNIYQTHKDPHSHWRPTYAEHLASFTTQYAYSIVVGFNLPKGVHYSPARRQRVATVPSDTKVGGGIFLHVRGAGDTAGCIAMNRADVQWLLRWLRPGRHPQVVMGPYDYVLTL